MSKSWADVKALLDDPNVDADTKEHLLASYIQDEGYAFGDMVAEDELPSEVREYYDKYPTRDGDYFEYDSVDDAYAEASKQSKEKGYQDRLAQEEVDENRTELDGQQDPVSGGSGAPEKADEVLELGRPGLKVFEEFIPVNDKVPGDSVGRHGKFKLEDLKKRYDEQVGLSFKKFMGDAERLREAHGTLTGLNETFESELGSIYKGWKGAAANSSYGFYSTEISPNTVDLIGFLESSPTAVEEMVSGVFAEVKAKANEVLDLYSPTVGAATPDIAKKVVEIANGELGDDDHDKILAVASWVDAETGSDLENRIRDDCGDLNDENKEYAVSQCKQWIRDSFNPEFHDALYETFIQTCDDAVEAINTYYETLNEHLVEYDNKFPQQAQTGPGQEQGNGQQPSDGQQPSSGQPSTQPSTGSSNPPPVQMPGSGGPSSPPSTGSSTPPPVTMPGAGGSDSGSPSSGSTPPPAQMPGSGGSETGSSAAGSTPPPTQMPGSGGSSASTPPPVTMPGGDDTSPSGSGDGTDPGDGTGGTNVPGQNPGLVATPTEGGEQQETVTIQDGDRTISVTSPDGQGNVKVTVDDGSGQPKSYDLDFGANDGLETKPGEAAQTSEPQTNVPDGAQSSQAPGAPPPTAPGPGDPITPGPDGTCVIQDGDLTITAERPDGASDTVTVTVDNGTGDPTTYSLDYSEGTAQPQGPGDPVYTGGSPGDPTPQPPQENRPYYPGGSPGDTSSAPVPPEAYDGPGPQLAATPADATMAAANSPGADNSWADSGAPVMPDSGGQYAATSTGEAGLASAADEPDKGGHGQSGMGGGMPMMGGAGAGGGGGDQERGASQWRTTGNLFDESTSAEVDGAIGERR